MRSFRGLALVAAFSLVLFAGKPASSQEEEQKSPLPENKKERACQDKKRFVTSLTIFPVSMMGAQHKNVAQALGLLFEKGGFRKLEISEKTFRPGKKDETFDQRVNSFGAFVAGCKGKTDYALYAEFEGSGKEGVKGVNGVVVDRKGKIVWKDIQARKDPDFKKMKPNCPMSCRVFLSQRLEPVLILAPHSEREKEGPMARLWAEKSGTPDVKEQEAMAKRQDAFKKRIGKAKVVVFPVRVGEEVDREAAVNLAKLLNGQGLCVAEVAAKEHWLDVEPNSNEMRMLWDLAKQFRSYLEKEPSGAEYALYADYMFSPRDKRVFAVHFVVCDAQGSWVIADLQNEHQDDFNAIAPKSIDDCNRLAVRRLADYLK